VFLTVCDSKISEMFVPKYKVFSLAAIFICVTLGVSCKSSDLDSSPLSANDIVRSQEALPHEFISSNLRVRWYPHGEKKIPVASINHKKLLIVIPGLDLLEKENSNNSKFQPTIASITPTYWENNQLNFTFPNFSKKTSHDLFSSLACVEMEAVDTSDRKDGDVDNEDITNIIDLSQQNYQIAVTTNENIGEASVVNTQMTSKSKENRVLCDKNKSYNVGIFDLSEFSGISLRDLDKVLWDEESSDYIKDQIFLDLYSQILSYFKNNIEITIVGHSTGSGFALRFNKAINLAVKSKALPARLSLDRLSLLEPVINLEHGTGETYSMANRISKISLEHSQNIIEIYQQNEINMNSNDSMIRAFRSSTYGTSLVKLNLKKFNDRSEMLARDAHSYPVFWYFSSMLEDIRHPVKGSLSNNGFYAPSGGIDISYLNQLKSLPSSGVFTQVSGTNTYSANDDSFSFEIAY
jgi:hypothetical protein